MRPASASVLFNSSSVGIAMESSSYLTANNG
jgi:hypothetical protein